MLPRVAQGPTFGTEAEMNEKAEHSEAMGFFSQECLAVSVADLRVDEPDVKNALDRLVAEWHTRESSKEMIARALAVEMDGMFKKGTPFDTDRLRRNLAALPKRPTR